MVQVVDSINGILRQHLYAGVDAKKVSELKGSAFSLLAAVLEIQNETTVHIARYLKASLDFGAFYETMVIARALSDNQSGEVADAWKEV